MKIIAWNINGLKATVKKPYLFDLIDKEDPDIICFGETKLSCIDHNLLELPQYKYKYYSLCSVKKGYSGTAILSKKEPLNVAYGLSNGSPNDLDKEGRVITLEFTKYYLVHVYTPNSGEVLARLNYRLEWDIKFKEYLAKLLKKKKIIVCGDLNVANEDIDIHDPSHNKRSAGFTNEERDSFKNILSELNLIDTYRHLHPNKIEYSYWSYRMRSRERNKGWRIDYFLTSPKIKIKESSILSNIGSDHAPIKLVI